MAAIFRNLLILILACVTSLALIDAARAQQVNCQALMNELMTAQPGFGSPERAQRNAELYNQYCQGGANNQPSNVPKGSPCGGNKYCESGLKCASGGKCIAKDATDCGSGKFCGAGNKCSKQGGCLPKDAVDCGSFSCGAGNVCAANNKCLAAAHAQRLRGGGPIDRKTAKDIRPFAYIAADMEAGSDSGARKFGFRRAGGLEAILGASGKTQADIDEWRRNGFDAAVFTKDAGGGRTEVVIAFRGNGQDTGVSTQQRQQAAEYAKAVQQQYGDAGRITIVGHAFGGALASYVASLLDKPAVTFNAPRNPSENAPGNPADAPSVGKEDKPDQTNIITAGDQVSDPLAEPALDTQNEEGAKPLPGKTFVVEPKNATDDPHSIKSVIKAIEASAPSKEEANDADASTLPACPGKWVSVSGGMLCKCSDGLFAKLDDSKHHMTCP